MKPIEQIISEREIVDWDEAVLALHPDTDYEPIPKTGPVGVVMYQSFRGGIIPILTYVDGTQVIPSEGELFNIPKIFSKYHYLLIWVKTYHPSVEWIEDNKGIRTCLKTGG